VDAQCEIEQLRADLAASKARNEELEKQVLELTKAVEELRELLGRNSRNSNLPPSSDGPGQGPGKSKKKGKGRKRGGQPGHRGSHRWLLPPEKVDEFVNLFPSECTNCWRPLPEDKDPQAKRYQYTELERFCPHTTEYRRNAVVCPHCGHKTMATYDEDKIPRFAFGPRLMSVVAMLTGVYHLSRRQTVSLLWELLGLRISLGTVSNIEKRVSEAVKPAVDEAWSSAMMARVKHFDGTSWLQAGVMLSLWTIATGAVTVFKIVANSRKETLRKLFTRLRGVLVSDRATALGFWSMSRRQICWCHLIRKFVAFSERDGPASAIGNELLDYAAIVFAYWSDFKQGKLSRKQLQSLMAPVRLQVEAVLQRAVDADIDRLSGSCTDILKHRLALWTFVDTQGVEPTNNHAELELRDFVLWRKRSFGTQSQRGNLYAERLMTVARTARKQNINVLRFLSACCRADGHDVPSILSPNVGCA